MNRRLIIGLAGMFAALGIFMLYLAWPLMTGTDVVLHTQPVDPFDPFRGQYITIRYDISTIPQFARFISTGKGDLEPEKIRILNGDTIYVHLKQNETDNNIYSYDYASRSKPTSGLFIKGIVESTNEFDKTVSVNYGIEQYFFERGATFNMTNMTVHAKIASNGQARIVELLHDGKPVEMEYR